MITWNNKFSSLLPKSFVLNLVNRGDKIYVFNSWERFLFNLKKKKNCGIIR